MSNGSRSGSSREMALVAIPLLFVALAAIWFALRFADPAPPSKFVISAASKGSPYHTLATQYAETFKRNGITLEIRESSGSFANHKALMDDKAGVQAGFIQGGLILPSAAEGLASVGRVGYEPLWVFTTGEQPVERLADLKGKRVLIGPAGGGTAGLSTRLLKANGITAENTTLINRELPEYIELLSKGEADAGFLVLGAQARTVQTLLRTPGVRLMSFSNADAYTQKFTFLSRLELSEGVIDLGQKIPPNNVTLIATSTAVLVREDAHPALVNLLAQALHEVHRRPSMDASGEAVLFQYAAGFPTAADPEYPMSAEALRVHRSGAPFLQRFMPFWLATLVDRLVVTLLVALPVLIPLARFAPAIYRWRIRRRILYWYGVLRSLEADIRSSQTPDERGAKLARLDGLDAALDDLRVPLEFTDQVYELRQNIDAVRTRLMAEGGRRTLAHA